MDDELRSRFRAAAKACEPSMFWEPPASPAEALEALGRQARDLGVEEWDVYGDRGAVAQLEEEVASLLGKPAAAFFPSGVMAQQAALRTWCDRTGSRRVAIPDISHLLVHEEDGPRLLHDFEFVHLTTGRQVPTASTLKAAGPGLGAALVELPLRDAGCLLPTWDQLVELGAAAREAGVPLHADGARIWESQPWFDRPLDEIAAQVDSIYVSFYKGLAAMAGAVLAGPQDVVDEARTWRRRMGGTLYHLTPYAVSALAGLREHLPRMAETVAWARSLAAELTAQGLRCWPETPHTNTFFVYAEGDADAITTRVLEHMEQHHVQPSNLWQPADVPGWVMCELAVPTHAVRHDPAETAARMAQVVKG